MLALSHRPIRASSQLLALALGLQREPNQLLALTQTGGVFQSFDSARTWGLIYSGAAALGAPIGLAQDEQEPGLIFAAFQKGVVASSDGGFTWQTLEAPRNVTLTSLAHVNRTLFYGTTGGVWSYAGYR